MTAYYKLNYTGLSYLITSPEKNPERDLILNILRQNNQAVVSISQLEESSGMASQKIHEIIKSFSAKDFISKVAEQNIDTEQGAYKNLVEKIQVLASGGSLMLVDKNGLVIAEDGFVGIRKDFLAANAAHHVLKNEATKINSSESNGNNPWGVTIKWGSRKVLVQILYVGKKKFILVVDVAARLSKQGLILLVAFLARRYTSE